MSVNDEDLREMQKAVAHSRLALAAEIEQLRPRPMQWTDGLGWHWDWVDAKRVRKVQNSVKGWMVAEEYDPTASLLDLACGIYFARCEAAYNHLAQRAGWEYSWKGWRSYAEDSLGVSVEDGVSKMAKEILEQNPSWSWSCAESSHWKIVYKLTERALT